MEFYRRDADVPASFNPCNPLLRHSVPLKTVITMATGKTKVRKRKSLKTRKFFSNKLQEIKSRG